MRLRAARPVLGALLAAGLSACSGLAVINAVEPAGGVAVSRGLPYRDGARGALDVYRPLHVAPGAPVVVFLYGGGWDSGRRQDYRFVGLSLARSGFVAVVPDYRLYPEVRWPAFLQDNAEAVRWAHDHAAEYGGDTRRLVLLGHSAGAYDAAMLALDGRWLGAVGLDPRRDLRAVAGLAGPYDFLPLTSDKLRDLFGPPERRPDTQPINHVGPGAPPMFLGYDAGDTVVRPLNTLHLADKLRANGDEVEVRRYTHVDHALLIGAVAAPLRPLAPVLRDVVAFFDAHDAAPVASAR